MPVPSRRFSAGPASPLAGVSDAAWCKLVMALEVQPLNAVSESGGLGAYDIRPRRLVELGYAQNLQSTRTETGRQVYVCDFIAPWERNRFLADPIAQYAVLARSMLVYHGLARSGDLRVPSEVGLSGAFAILHVGGHGALRGWPDLFERTRELYERARGLF